MHSLILATATRFIMGLLFLFSVFLMLRGHNEPGGGFAGGLVAASAFALYAISFNLTMARRALRVDPRALVALGLFISAVSGIIPLFFNQPFLTGVWYSQKVPVIGKIGTPLLFDTGVYLVVLGVTLTNNFRARGGITMETILAVVVGGLYAAGLYMMLRRNIIKLIIGLVLLSQAANLLIFTSGGLLHAYPPLIPEGMTLPATPYADPLPQALILTAIVISFGVLAFAMALVFQVHKHVGTGDLDELKGTIK